MIEDLLARWLPVFIYNLDRFYADDAVTPASSPNVLEVSLYECTKLWKTN